MERDTFETHCKSYRLSVKATGEFAAKTPTSALYWRCIEPAVLKSCIERTIKTEAVSYPRPSMYGIFTDIYKSTKCRLIYHTWIVWVLPTRKPLYWTHLRGNQKCLGLARSKGRRKVMPRRFSEWSATPCCTYASPCMECLPTTYIYQKYNPNVSEYIPYIMEHIWDIVISCFGLMWTSHHCQCTDQTSPHFLGGQDMRIASVETLVTKKR